MDDCVKKFMEFYEKGDLISAVDQIIPSPDISYDKLQSSEDWLPHLIHFIDASVFKSIPEARNQNLVLGRIIALNSQKFEVYQEAVNNLKLEQKFLFFLLDNDYHSLKEKMPEFFQILLWVEKEKVPVGMIEIEHILTYVPKNFQLLMKFHLMMAWGKQKFKKSKPLYMMNFSRKYFELSPWYPLQYSLSIPSLERCPSDKIPIIFFEPIKDDLSNFLHLLKGRPAIFAFTTISNFFQMLQFPSFADSITEPEHLVYILELYPNQQFGAQDLELFVSKDLYPIFLRRQNTWKPMLRLFCRR